MPSRRSNLFLSRSSPRCSSKSRSTSIYKSPQSRSCSSYFGKPWNSSYSRSYIDEPFKHQYLFNSCHKIKNRSEVEADSIGSPVGLVCSNIKITSKKGVDQDSINFATYLKAFALIYVLPEVDWTSENIDTLLKEGADLFKSSSDDQPQQVQPAHQRHPLVHTNTRHRQATIYTKWEQRIHRKFTIEGHTFTVELEPRYLGDSEQLQTVPELKPPHIIANLKIVMKAFFRTGRYCLLWTKRGYLLIWRRRKAFFVLDVKGRRRDDLISDGSGDGVAMLVYLKTLDNVVFMVSNLSGISPRDNFTLRELVVTRLVTPNGRVFMRNSSTRAVDFEVINHNYAYLKSTLHLSTNPQRKMRNRSSLMVCVAAILSAKIDHPATWNTHMYDRLMCYGVELCRRCWDSCANTDLPIFLDTFPEQLRLGQFVIELRLLLNVGTGNWRCHSNQFEGGDFEQQLTQTLDEYSNALFQINSQVYALWVKNSYYYMLDPYRHRILGAHIETDRTQMNATVRMFRDMKTLISVFHQVLLESNKHSTFNIHTVRILNMAECPRGFALSPLPEGGIGDADVASINETICFAEENEVCKELLEVSDYEEDLISYLSLESEDMAESMEEEEYEPQPDKPPPRPQPKPYRPAITKKGVYIRDLYRKMRPLPPHLLHPTPTHLRSDYKGPWKGHFRGPQFPKPPLFQQRSQPTLQTHKQPTGKTPQKRYPQGSMHPPPKPLPPYPVMMRGAFGSKLVQPRAPSGYPNTQPCQRPSLPDEKYLGSKVPPVSSTTKFKSDCRSCFDSKATMWKLQESIRRHEAAARARTEPICERDYDRDRDRDREPICERREREQQESCYERIVQQQRNVKQQRYDPQDQDRDRDHDRDRDREPVCVRREREQRESCYERIMQQQRNVKQQRYDPQDRDRDRCNDRCREQRQERGDCCAERKVPQERGRGREEQQSAERQQLRQNREERRERERRQEQREREERRDQERQREPVFRNLEIVKMDCQKCRDPMATPGSRKLPAGTHPPDCKCSKTKPFHSVPFKPPKLIPNKPVPMSAIPLKSMLVKSTQFKAASKSRKNKHISFKTNKPKGNNSSTTIMVEPLVRPKRPLKYPSSKKTMPYEPATDAPEREPCMWCSDGQPAEEGPPLTPLEQRQQPPLESSQGQERSPLNYPGYTRYPHNLAVAGSESGTVESLTRLLSSAFKATNRVLTMTPWGNYVVFKHRQPDSNSKTYYVFDGCTCDIDRFRHLDLRFGTAGLLPFQHQTDVVCHMIDARESRAMKLLSTRLDEPCQRFEKFMARGP